MSDDLQIFVLPDDGQSDEELIGDEFLDELWHATARAPRPYPGAPFAGTYMFGADVLGALGTLSAEMRAPGSTGTNPAVLADRMKSIGQRAVDAGKRAIASSRRYAAGRKIGQKAIDAGQKAISAGQKAKAAVQKTAKDALKAAASSAPSAPKASAAPSGSAKRNLAAAAAPVARAAAPVQRVAPAASAKRAAPVAPAARAVAGKRTLVRGDVLGADSATPQALEAAAAAWTVLADAVDRMNTAGDAAVQVAQKADQAGLDAQPVWDALAEAFADERSAKGFAQKQGFVVAWTSYGFSPEIGEGAAEAKSTADQWVSNMEGLLQPLRDQLTTAAPADPAAAPSAPGPFDPGSAGGGGSGGGGSEGGSFDPYEEGSDESEALQAFRQSGIDPFDEEASYAAEAANDEMPMEEDPEYDPEAAEAMLEEDDAYAATSGEDSGDPSFSPRRLERSARIADSFETDEDAQAFVARRSLLEDDQPVEEVEDTVEGLDFDARYIFLPHTAITDWQQEQRDQQAARNITAEQAQTADAKAAAAVAALRATPTGKLSPAVAMRLAAARRRLAEQKARLDASNAATVDESEVE